MRRTTPHIRITKNDRQEYARLVRNTKAKIRRTHKNYGIDLSDEIPLPSIEEFTSREQFNEWKNKQKSFTSVANRNYQFKKNEYGVVATKRELEEIERNTKKAQDIIDNLRKEVEKKPFFVKGKQQGTVGQELLKMANPNNLMGFSRPKDFKFDEIRTRRQLEQKLENLEKKITVKYYDEKIMRGKDAFIRLVEMTFNSDANELVEKLKQIPVDEFYELYLQEEAFRFDYFYTDESLSDNFVKLNDAVERYLNGEIDMGLKGFPPK